MFEVVRNLLELIIYDYQLTEYITLIELTSYIVVLLIFSAVFVGPFAILFKRGKK